MLGFVLAGAKASPAGATAFRKEVSIVRISVPSSVISITL